MRTSVKGVQVVAMDAFTGFKAAATQALPEAREVMAPFHVVALAGDKLDQCRRRLQHQTTGHRAPGTQGRPCLPGQTPAAHRGVTAERQGLQASRTRVR